MYELPTEIIIDGQSYSIRNKGDYRLVLDCLSALQDIELSNDDRVLTALIIFYDNLNNEDDIFNTFNTQENLVSAISEMYKFFNCGNEDSVGMNTGFKVIDWEDDSQLIVSGINKVSNKEIRSEPYIHWWTFMGYFISIGDSPLSTVVGIRYKILKGKKLEKWEREYRQNNPNYFRWNSKTTEQQEAEKYVMEMWNSNK